MVYRTIRGMKDLYGTEFEKYNYIIEKASLIAKKHCFKCISTPILEYTEVFQRSIGDETDVVSKEMYTFTDKGGDSITLRPEGTAGVIRAIVSENLAQLFPVKLMYHGPMFRYDRPQKGRFRQFHQLGFENVSEKSPYTDALMIVMANDILNSIGLFSFKVFVNTLGDETTKSDYTKAIVKYLSRHEEDLSEDSKRRLKTNPLRILDSKDQTDKEICSMAPIMSDYLSKESGVYFNRLCNLLSEYGINFDLDPFLVRGLDYYSHTTFEVKPVNHGFRDAICGGGRYDSLMKQFGGPDVSGMGFAFGMERLMMLLNTEMFEDKTKKVAIIPVSDEESDYAFHLLKNLYACNIPTEFLHTGTLTKKMKSADRLNCEIAVIIGESEKENKTAAIKFMNKTEERYKSCIVPINDLVKFLQFHISN